ncbi:MAG: 4Fe-4S dicluster domain-containing protein [Acidaminococcales bacterium]|nr:4Fe-4S dicluster domain-containing protein [Acidaminococcales bacterium]
MQNNYFHSVKFDKEQCKGCVTCIKFCPTEAIRIRGGKARIIQSRCIDCGECIRRCPHHAKRADTDTLTDIGKFNFNVALPAPALYSQFAPAVSREKIFAALHRLGFDAVYEVALAAEYVTLEIESYMKNRAVLKKPMISSACPAIIRLIQVRFPSLVGHIIPILPPVEVAATEARREFTRATGLAAETIGVWFLTPCPAKATNIRQPVDVTATDLSGAIGISSFYGEMKKILGAISEADIEKARASSYGIGWGYAGGEIRATGLVNSLIVHGVKEVADVLEQIEMSKMDDVDYVECLACPGGCIGGALLPENRFVAEKNLKLRVRRLRDREPAGRRQTILGGREIAPGNSAFRHKTIQPRPIMKLDDNIVVAMKKVGQIKQILAELPGIDCGACGSPTCASLAEDIVQGLAAETDCVFKLRQVVNALEEEMGKPFKNTRGEPYGSLDKTGE